MLLYGIVIVYYSDTILYVSVVPEASIIKSMHK